MRRATLALMLGGCSALGLTDGLEQAQGCADCAALNDLEPPGECLSWECSDPTSPTLAVCVVDLFDGDDDGAPRMDCASDERLADCDDADPTSAPTLFEVCDGRDNDCDGLVDEDVSFTAATLASGRLSGVSWALGDPGVAGAYFDDQTFLWIVTDETDEPPRVVSSQMRPNPRSVLGPAGPNFAVGVLQSTCPSYATGAWVSGESTVAVDPRHAMAGVATPVACAGPSTRVDSAAIVGRDPNVFVTAFVHADGAVDACGEMVGGTAVVAALRRESTGPVAAGDATRVGAHQGLGPPALLDLGDLGVLLTQVGADSVELYRLTFDFTAPAPVQTQLALSIPCDGVCGHLALAGLEGGVVGIAYRDGSCASPEVRFIRVQVSADAVSAMDPSPLTLGSGDIRRVSVAARAASPSWAVAWADGQNLRARRVDAEPVGERLKVRTSAGFFVEPLLLTYDAALTVYAYDGNAEQLVSATASCSD